MEWGREEVLSLIELYCSNSCLWDLEDPNYKNRELKREAVLSIAAQLSRDVLEVEKKMHGLRTQFNREHKRYQKQLLLNGRLRHVQKPTWFAYEPLEFVAKCISPRLPKGIKQEEPDEEEDTQEASWSGFEVEVENDGTHQLDGGDEIELNSDGSVVQHESEIVVECLSSQNNGTVGERNNSSPSISTIRKEIKIDPDKPLRGGGGLTLNKRPRLFSEKGEKIGDKKEGLGGKLPPGLDKLDEFTAFSHYVQQELRKIANPFALQMTKLKINQILFEGTTGTYDRLPSNISNVKTPARSQMVITSKIQPYEPQQQP